MRRQFGTLNLNLEVQKANWHVAGRFGALRGDLAHQIFPQRSARRFGRPDFPFGTLAGDLARQKFSQRSARRFGTSAGNPACRGAHFGAWKRSRQLEQRPAGAVRVAMAEEDRGGPAEETAGSGEVALVPAQRGDRQSSFGMLLHLPSPEKHPTSLDRLSPYSTPGGVPCTPLPVLATLGN